MTGKALIVHADDLGMTHSVNAATFKALACGNITSGSVMVPCPWFLEVAHYTRTNPQADLGIHLTLTSERSSYRWRPTLSIDSIPTLVDDHGYFHQSPEVAIDRIDPSQAEAELRAQIERAYGFGIRPTHLDSHQAIMYSTPELLDCFRRLGRDYRLPILLSKGLLRRRYGGSPSIHLLANDVLEEIVTISPNVAPNRWESFYSDAIRVLPSGVSQVTVHLAYDDEEMRAATHDRASWGAAWRQRDLDYFTGDAFARLIHAESIRLLTWREFSKIAANPQI